MISLTSSGSAPLPTNSLYTSVSSATVELPKYPSPRFTFLPAFNSSNAKVANVGPCAFADALISATPSGSSNGIIVPIPEKANIGFISRLA